MYSWRPVIIVAFDFRTKCAVTDRIETAYIVDDLQLLLFEPNVTCMQGLEIHFKPEYGPGGDSVP